MSKQQRTIGAIIKIDLYNGYHTYGRILHDAAFAFYDSLTNEEDTDLQSIITKDILFITNVYNDAVTSGRWKKVGKLPLEDHLLVLPPTFIQDPINPDQFRIYFEGTIRPANKEECIGLERAAVWSPEDVEERIRNHYANEPNKFISRDRDIFIK